MKGRGSPGDPMREEAHRVQTRHAARGIGEELGVWEEYGAEKRGRKERSAEGTARPQSSSHGPRAWHR